MELYQVSERGDLAYALASCRPITRTVIDGELFRTAQRLVNYLPLFPTLSPLCLQKSGRGALDLCNRFFTHLVPYSQDPLLFRAICTHKGVLIAQHGVRALRECETTRDYLAVSSQISWMMDHCGPCQEQVVQCAPIFPPCPEQTLVCTIARWGSGPHLLPIIATSFTDRLSSPKEWNEIGRRAASLNDLPLLFWLLVGARASQPTPILTAADRIAPSLRLRPEWSPQQADLLKQVVANLQPLGNGFAGELRALGAKAQWLASHCSPDAVLEQAAADGIPNDWEGRQQLIDLSIELRNLDETTIDHVTKLAEWTGDLELWQPPLREEWVALYAQLLDRVQS